MTYKLKAISSLGSLSSIYGKLSSLQNKFYVRFMYDDYNYEYQWLLHYNDVIFMLKRFKSLATRLFVQHRVFVARIL